ncbi:MAG: hypothetical protein KAT74_00465 [Candidatus Cloacimonetes bacterium]|nr:hypothetical protein [Candidatus Cloacimonadota bacterium]
MKRIILGLILVLLISYLNSEISPRFLNPEINTPSIFNLNNITMSHTMSFSTGIFSNKQGYYQSLYTNHINYVFNSKLNLQVDLNFINFGTATYKKGFEIEGNKDNESRIFPEFTLTYKPSEDVNIVFEYKNVNSSNFYNPYYKNWRW